MNQRTLLILFASAVLFQPRLPLLAEQPDFSQVPGVVIHHRAAAGKQYIGSPGIVRLRDQVYLTKCDLFGPGSSEWQSAVSLVFRSDDAGQSWRQIAAIDGLFWASIFTNRGAAYLLGTTKHHGRVVIRRSTDEGATWTKPVDEHTGLLTAEGEYHTAPMPVLEHDGRLWRGMEDAMGGTKWGERYRAFMMSVPADADLLTRANWTFSNVVPRDPAWLGGKFGGWLEGNAVLTPDGGVVDILRADYNPQGGKAAVIRISDDGKTATFAPADGFIDLPGGAKKFTIRYDDRSRHYWSLANWVPPHVTGTRASSTRNTLALIRSPDLKKWEVRCVILHHPDVARHGFQYVDWLFEGDDLIAACRTAYDDGLGGARNAHDANFLTFHRIRRFRDLTMNDSVAMPKP